MKPKAPSSFEISQRRIVFAGDRLRLLNEMVENKRGLDWTPEQVEKARAAKEVGDRLLAQHSQRARFQIVQATSHVRH